MPGPESNRPSDEEPQAAGPPNPAESVLPEDLCAAFKSELDPEGKLAVLRRHFDLKAISDPAELCPGVLCALRKEAELYLVEIGALKEDRRTVDLRLYFSARHAKPAPLAALVDLGRKGALHRLEHKAPETLPQAPALRTDKAIGVGIGRGMDCQSVQDPDGLAIHPTPVVDSLLLSPEIAEAATGPEAASQAENEPTIYGAQQIDLTSFTRLISLAQSCGMVPNVDAIGAVRDADFRAGHYLTAYYNIERMCTSLTTAAQQRQQQLRREDIAYRSGRLRMSPREWSQKLARETAKTQSIDRALSQFRKVMAGLRLRALAAQQIGGQSDAGR